MLGPQENGRLALVLDVWNRPFISSFLFAMVRFSQAVWFYAVRVFVGVLSSCGLVSTVLRACFPLFVLFFSQCSFKIVDFGVYNCCGYCLVCLCPNSRLPFSYSYLPLPLAAAASRKRNGQKRHGRLSRKSGFFSFVWSCLCTGKSKDHDLRTCELVS